jgi:exonuclease SbcC
LGAERAVILRRFRARHYRQYATLDLALPAAGLIGITGANGSGKSSLIEACRFVAFGPDACRTTKDRIATTGLEGPCWAEVTYETADGRMIVARRELDGDAKVTVDGKLAAKSARGVTEYVTALFGMDAKAWALAFDCQQKELDAFSRLRPAQRREQLLRWLGILRLDKAIEAVRKDGGMAKARWETVSAVVPDPAGLEAERDHAQDQLTEQTTGLVRDEQVLTETEEALAAARTTLEGHEARMARAQALDVEIRVGQETLNRLQARQADLRAQLETLAALEAEVVRLTSEVATLPTALAEAEDLRRRREDHARATATLASARTSLAALDAELARLDSQGADVEVERAALARLEQDEQTAREALAALREQVAGLTSTLRTEEAALATARARFQRLRDLGAEAQCPTCEQPLGAQYGPLVERVMREGLDLRAAVEGTRGALTTAELEVRRRDPLGRGLAEQVAGRRRAVADAEHAIAQRAALQAQRRVRLGELQAAAGACRDGPVVSAEAVQAAEETIARLQTRDRERERGLGRLASREGLRREQADLATRIGEAERTIQKARATLAWDPDRLEVTRRAVSVAQDRRQAGAVAVERSRAAVAATRATVDRLSRSLDQARNQWAEAQDARSRSHALSRLAECLVGFRSGLVGRIQAALARLASALFVMLVDGRYEALRLTDDYEIEIQKDGAWHPAAYYSGGEVDLASVALRLAVAQLIRGTTPASFILLDEPFTSLDPVYLGNALRALRHLQTVFPQIVVISHLDSLKDAATTMLTVTVDAQGLSHVRQEG